MVNDGINVCKVVCGGVTYSCYNWCGCGRAVNFHSSYIYIY